MIAVSIVGGRPNLIKVEPVHVGLSQAGIRHLIVDVGVFHRPYGPGSFEELVYLNHTLFLVLVPLTITTSILSNALSLNFSRFS